MKAKHIVLTATLIVAACLSTSAWAAEAAPTGMAPAPAMTATMDAPMAAQPMEPVMAASMEAMATGMSAPPAPAAMAAPVPPMEPVMAAVAPAPPMAPAPEPMNDPVAKEFESKQPVATEPPADTTHPDAEQPMDATEMTAEKAPVATATMDATKTSAHPATASKDDKAVLWLGIITIILLSLLTVLGSLGLLKWTKKERGLKILKMADKILDGLAIAAKATTVKWDDALVAMLHDIDARLIAIGESALADAEKEALKSVAATRKNQIVPPDSKVEEKSEVKDAEKK